jgi:hypothetical protein
MKHFTRGEGPKINNFFLRILLQNKENIGLLIKYAKYSAYIFYPTYIPRKIQVEHHISFR